eukprot:gnl/TRDRNA2_/TRDRNA2_143648_c3_seq2.p1 gnl/TRDRNA2_/TRDRNA2_143648_c3~~gnl/TRDRNA2_/TRDRNA2_143648_c3_seq2.p1  ORF type:complete len:213 (-),score=51.50 gnl/TRDRNA2_/TRDRNA2_143648_c3_seq2:54-650(-)
MDAKAAATAAASPTARRPETHQPREDKGQENACAFPEANPELATWVVLRRTLADLGAEEPWWWLRLVGCAAPEEFYTCHGFEPEAEEAVLLMEEEMTTGQGTLLSDADPESRILGDHEDHEKPLAIGIPGTEDAAQTCEETPWMIGEGEDVAMQDSYETFEGSMSPPSMTQACGRDKMTAQNDDGRGTADEFEVSSSA